MLRPLTNTERTEAQRRIEVDDALLRNVRSDATRLRARAQLLRGEIAGARQAIEEKERRIHEAEASLAALDERLASLTAHETQLLDDQSAWSGRLAG